MKGYLIFIYSCNTNLFILGLNQIIYTFVGSRKISPYWGFYIEAGNISYFFLNYF